MPPRTRKKRPTTSQRRRNSPSPQRHASPPPSPPPTSAPPVDSGLSATTYALTAYQSPMQDSDTESPIKQHCHRALEALHGGRTKESLKIVKRSLSRHPNSAAVHRTLAFVHFQLAGDSDDSARVQHFQKAAASAEKSLAISPNQIGLIFLHNHVLFELARNQEDYQRIIQQCQQSLQIQDPIDPKNNILVIRNETEDDDLATKDSRIESARRELRELVERVNNILRPVNESKEEEAMEKKNAAEEKKDDAEEKKDDAGEKESMEEDIGTKMNSGKLLAPFVETRKNQEQVRKSMESILEAIREMEKRLCLGYGDASGPEEEDERKKLGREYRVLDCWKRMSGQERRRFLRVNVDEIVDYYIHDESVIKFLMQAIDFWQKWRRWKFWRCCCCEEMDVVKGCWINHMTAEHIGLPSLSEMEKTIVPPKVDPTWADKIVNGVWKPVDANKILKDIEGQETQAEMYRDEGKWPFCEDSEREEKLKEIRAVLKLFLSNECLSQSVVKGLIVSSNDHLQMSDRIPGLDQTPLCICFLGPDELQKTLLLLQQISLHCQLDEPREVGSFYDEIHGEEYKEIITLANGFSCLLLDECVLRGEVESQNCCNAVPDGDNFVFWLYSGNEIEELLKTWTNLRSFKIHAAAQAFHYHKLELKHMLSLCKTIRWLGKYEQAYEVVNKMCLAEENKRVSIPDHKPQSFSSLLLKRREELAGITEDDGIFEHRFIIDALKLIQDICLRLSDLKAAEGNEQSRINIQAAAAEPYLRRAMMLKLLDVREQLFSVDALLMKSLADMRWAHHNFSVVSSHDYQPIMLHLLKSFLQAYLESFADNAAKRTKARHEPLLMLTEAALNLENTSKVDDDSRKGNNTKNTKSKDKKKHKANRGIKELQPPKKKNKEIVLPTTSAGDDPATRIRSEMREEEASSSKMLSDEMIELERNSEYQRKFEDETKQKRVPEKYKKVSDTKLQNMEDEQLRSLIESEGMDIEQMVEQQRKIEDEIKQKGLAEQNKKIREATTKNMEDNMPLVSKPGEAQKSNMPEKPQPLKKKNKEIVLPITSAGDVPDTRITLEMQKEEASSSKMLSDEMIELERNSEYRRKFKDEAKKMRVTKKYKKISDIKPQNAEDEQLRRLIESEGMDIEQMIEQQRKIEDEITQKRLAEQNKMSKATIENTEDDMPFVSKPDEAEKSSMTERPPQQSQAVTVADNTIRIGDLCVPLVSKPSWADRTSVFGNPSKQSSMTIRIGDIDCKVRLPTEACSKPGEANVPIEQEQLKKSGTVTLPGTDAAEVGDTYPQARNVGLNCTGNVSGEGEEIPDMEADGITDNPDADIFNDPDLLTMDQVLPYCRFFNRTNIKRSKRCMSFVSEDRGYMSEPE